MQSSTQAEREARAGRNQALFRRVNEKLKTLNESVARATETFTIACECADTACVEMIDIRPDEYEAVRAEPRHFAVLPGHVHADVERVVCEREGCVVVEKAGAAADVAEVLEQEAQAR